MKDLSCNTIDFKGTLGANFINAIFLHNIVFTPDVQARSSRIVLENVVPT